MRFAFGENWASFAQQVTDQQVDDAVEGLRSLFPDDALRGASMLDIGCGSGLSMVAALRLGASQVTGVDIDPRSVETAKALLTRFCPDQAWSVSEKSVFDLSVAQDGAFPVVYSWGVLHHTGDMDRAIRAAAGLVAPGGRLAIAIYRKTPMCGFWKIEKRIYASSGPAVQSALRGIYNLAFRTKFAMEGAKYEMTRGMDHEHDVHDWLGGYPYESAHPDEIVRLLTSLGFETRHIDKGTPRLGLFGTGCHEYVGRHTA